MTNRLRSVLLAAEASLGFGALGIAPAYAVIVPPSPNTADFVFVETPSGTGGTYTIIYRSSDWYIWAFDVTNPQAGIGGTPTTSQPNWFPDICSAGCPVPAPAFAYNNVNGAFSDLVDDVGPGETVSLFG
jgi:hypothetical protein